MRELSLIRDRFLPILRESNDRGGMGRVGEAGEGDRGMKCRFEHDDDCCNSGSPQYMCKCKPDICHSSVHMTNADRIRAMSKEELAQRLLKYEGTEKRATPYGGHEHIFHGPHGETCGTKEYALQLWMEWLDEPAEVD